MLAGNTSAFFADRLDFFGVAPAVISASGAVISYCELARRADEFASTLEGRKLLVIEVRNDLQPIVAYLGALRSRHPVLLVEDGSIERDKRIVETFSPHSVYRQRD